MFPTPVFRSLFITFPSDSSSFSYDVKATWPLLDAPDWEHSSVKAPSNAVTSLNHHRATGRQILLRVFKDLQKELRGKSSLSLTSANTGLRKFCGLIKASGGCKLFYKGGSKVEFLFMSVDFGLLNWMDGVSGQYFIKCFHCYYLTWETSLFYVGLKKEFQN